MRCIQVGCCGVLDARTDELIIPFRQPILIPMSLFWKKKPSYPQLDEDGTVNLDERTFDEFVTKNPKVVVMFHRTTCGHSVNMYPVFSELRGEMTEVKFIKVSTPTNMSLVHKYDVKGTPTFMMMVNGKNVKSLTGEISKEILRAEIELVSSI